MYEDIRIKMEEEIRKPTDGELEILQILWREGSCSVRQVNEQLNLQREVGYTTTLKLMQIMADKGLVVRDTSHRQHIYRASVQEAHVQRSALQKVIDTAFQGSASGLIMQALGNHRTSEEELREIKALIEKLESEYP